MPTLTGIDVLGIQRYVFASNRLRDAVAASWLVHWATAADGALQGNGGDVLLASGGNAILRFDDLERARDFVARYTRRLYDEAPGLEVAVAHRDFDHGRLASALRHLQKDLARAKLERVPSAPQLGLSVTASCRITGLPAAGVDPEDARLPLSRMVLRWRDPDVSQRAMERWNTFVPADARFAFPAKVDDMGRTRGDTSLVGVVHIDGNGLGEQIARWQSGCVGALRSDDEVESELRTWATSLDDAGHRALRAVVDRVMGALDDEARIVGAIPDLGFDLRREDGKVVLPLRPILLGGDDMTFICDGRLALHLAEVALESFTGEIPHIGAVSACAGVALVPPHTPFDRARELAEVLCASAKARRRDETDSGSWIDWHIGVPPPRSGVADLRRRAFAHRLGEQHLELTCRPYRLGASATDRETWRWLARTVLGSGEEGFRGERWNRHRNKLKELASVVREGPDGVRSLRESWTVASALKWPGGLDQTDGFLGGSRTPLLDAIELLDIHLPLSEETAS